MYIIFGVNEYIYQLHAKSQALENVQNNAPSPEPVEADLEGGGGCVWARAPLILGVLILLYINFRPPKLPTVHLAFSLISCPPNEMFGSATAHQLYTHTHAHTHTYTHAYTHTSYVA